LLLADMLSVDGDGDAVMETRIYIGWNKFRQLVGFMKAVLVFFVSVRTTT